MEIMVILEGVCGEIRRLKAKPETSLDDAMGFAEESVYNGMYARATVEVDGESYCEYEM